MSRGAPPTNLAAATASLGRRVRRRSVPLPGRRPSAGPGSPTARASATSPTTGTRCRAASASPTPQALDGRGRRVAGQLAEPVLPRIRDVPADRDQLDPRRVGEADALVRVRVVPLQHERGRPAARRRPIPGARTSPATPAATDVTIATRSAAEIGCPSSASWRRATFISPSRLVDPDGSQSAPSATGIPAPEPLPPASSSRRAAGSTAATTPAGTRRRPACAGRLRQRRAVDDVGRRRRRPRVEERLELLGAPLVAADALAEVQVEGVDVAGPEIGHDLLQPRHVPRRARRAGRSSPAPCGRRRSTGPRCAPTVPRSCWCSPPTTPGSPSRRPRALAPPHTGSASAAAAC